MTLTVQDIVRNAKQRAGMELERQKQFAAHRIQAELKIDIADARAQVEAVWDTTPTDPPSAPHGPARGAAEIAEPSA